MTNRMWVTLPPFFCKAISSHFIPWPTVCEWHSLLVSERQSHHISSHDQQRVSDTPSFFLQNNLITLHPMTNSKWVTLLTFLRKFHDISSHDNSKWVTLPPFFCKAISSHFIPWPTGCEWHSLLFSARQSHHISSHDQQFVSDTPSFVLQGNLITFHPMTNSKWVTLPTFLRKFQDISSHDQQEVSDTPSFFCKAISLHFISWPTVCEWHSLLCSARQSHHISSHDQQRVSDTPSFFLQGNLITWPTGSKSLSPFSLPCNHFIAWPPDCEQYNHFPSAS